MKKLTTQEEVDEAVEEWHIDLTIEVSLHEFLGWTWEEYARHVETGAIPSK